ncbi:iron-containing alcohol dehydrogenase [Alicyclobacillus sp.]|uniref:iron-containing alcohol dehydrogenase family protein n=1 Tax=Alicyclobacillus sp. TaxID=61169 RepID=UPI0025C3B6AF|nr:iron-containing alcohol dehydrogenase [Alicyclobacillus sp.]MCL6517593.1 iron-containing alcohol dehydrogenase [Alicyclobacillus sp.]
MSTVFLPVRIEFAPGRSGGIGEDLRGLGSRRPLVVTDPGVHRAGLLEGVLASLREAGETPVVFAEVVPDPDEACAARAAQRFREEGCDGILAVGGGSSIDTAKAAGVLATNPGPLLAYEGVNKIPNAIPPLAVIPTTCGTGSEVTNVTVITDEHHYKTPILSPYLIPKLAVLDPDLLKTLPPQLVASTGMDALTHAMESYTNRVQHWYAEACAMQAMRMIAEAIRPATVNRDPEAIGRMLYASTLAGVAFTLSRLGLVHAMSHPVSGFAGVPHGLANAVLLPHVMGYNMVGNPEAYAAVARALGVPDQGSPIRTAEAGVREVMRMNRDLGIPDRFEGLGVTREMFPAMIRDTFRSGNIPINPRVVTEADVARLYEAVLTGEAPV